MTAFAGGTGSRGQELQIAAALSSGFEHGNVIR